MCCSSSNWRISFLLVDLISLPTLMLIMEHEEVTIFKFCNLVTTWNKSQSKSNGMGCICGIESAHNRPTYVKCDFCHNKLVEELWYFTSGSGLNGHHCWFSYYRQVHSWKCWCMLVGKSKSWTWKLNLLVKQSRWMCFSQRISWKIFFKCLL